MRTPHTLNSERFETPGHTSSFGVPSFVKEVKEQNTGGQIITKKAIVEKDI